MLIEFRDVHKSFKKTEILKGINFSVKKEELVSLIGPSGCGKTTTLKMINGLETPTSGEVLIDGKNVSETDLIKLRRKMGYVIQQTGLFPHMTIQENIEIIPKLSGIKSEERLEKTKEMMRMIGLPPEEYLWRYPSQLSGGQLQRIGVARAFAVDPEIILMDEPFSALDPVTREQLQDEVVMIQNHMRKTIVFVTHDMEEAIKLSDKICIMNDGKIVQYDTPENILKNPSDGFVEKFVGKNRVWSNPTYIKAEDIMIKRPVKGFEELSIIKAMELMRCKQVDSILVVDEQEHFKGFVLAEDIQHVKLRNQSIKKFMKTPKAAVSPEESIIDLLKRSRDFNASRMPVLDKDGRLLGLITKSSLVTTLSSQFIDTKEVEADG